LLVFAPLILAHLVLDLDAIVTTAYAFMAFSLCASSVYILNDLTDLSEDRRHPKKRLRPFASGALPLRHGLMMIPALLAGALAIASQLPIAFGIVLGVYFALTLAYTFAIKRVMLWDVILLAGLYTIRIMAGSAALAIPHSFWLIAFSIFLFFSLAMVKRYTELRRSDCKSGLIERGRGYRTEDLESLSQFGIASGLISVLVLALYIDSPVVKTLYNHSEVIWLICPIMLYLIARVWVLARRDEIADDPIVFLINDRRSQITMAAGGALILLATL
jgi:4-hydroxybenzoate polyprenyltransferase